ncbi:MAG: glycoside hydrolase family 5 protein [Chloroflexi bacterium]|nr:glycoside hydrolase family 5 protein [Chloroflexota bacterium]
MKRALLIVSLATLTLFACAPATTLAPTPAAAAATFALPRDPSTMPDAPPTELPSPFLHVHDREILDASGQAVLLRGVNMDTYYYSFLWEPNAPWEYAVEEDIQYLASLGVTAIRLGLHWRYFETSLGFDLIDTYLGWCERAGIYVILDMHVVPPEDDILQGKIWDDPAAQQQFLDLWTAIAARYAERTRIAGYDLYNEPAPPNAAQWWELAGRAAAAIRAVDANHILFVENPLIEGSSFQLLTDANVVYSFHDYSPFAVSHAGAGWVGDSPVPDDYFYPGPALVGMEWANWSEDAAAVTSSTAEWVYWDSGVLTAPSGVEFATLKPAADGNVGEVWFDDLELEHNGAAQAVFNPGMEDASQSDDTRPAHWSFWSDSGFSGEWSSDQVHGGTHSLKIASDGDGFGIWQQAEWILVEPLFRVQAGDTFQVRGWIYAPEINGGSASLGLDYLNGVYENYDRARLLADMQPYRDWAAANNVPLHVGEFGCMSTAPGDSRYHLVADKISLMNEAGLHWALWTFREASPPGFGLYFGDNLDERLSDILRQGLGTAPLSRVFLPLVNAAGAF